MTLTPSDLADALASSPESDYVRIAADWLRRGTVTDEAPSATGLPVVDALVAAVAAHLARSQGREVPSWTHEPSRILPSFWHPGGDRFFSYSLAHTPAEFAARGVIVEQDSLVSV